MTANDPANPPPADGVSRRTVLGVSAAGVGALTLAACSKAPSPAGPSSTGSSSGGQSAGNGGAGGGGAKVLAALSSIQVGSSISAKGADGGDILISRLAAETVVAFSAVCPHQGCTVGSSFTCPCHGSTFDPKTGAHLGGPAPTGLSTVPVSVSGNNVVAG